MVAGAISDRPEVILRIAPPPQKRSPTGRGNRRPNASGKTNVISALQFVKEAVESSHREWKPDGLIPRQPFLLDEASRASPSEFIVDTIVDGVRYQYGFAVTDKAVTEEWLNAYPNGEKQGWFSRKLGKSIRFSSKMGGENRTIEGLTRPE